MKYGYYPGCSMDKNAKSYHDSMMAIAPYLDLEFEKLDDWNCCGATEYSSISGIGAFALVARNLAIAEDQLEGKDLVAGCSACFLNLTKTDHHMADSLDLKEKVNTALDAGGFSYTPGSVVSRHLLEVITSDIGFEKVAENVSRPLYGLKVAPYYGCMVVRPGYLGAFDYPEYPTSMDTLIETLGAEATPFTMKSSCCGGHMTQIKELTALEMIRQLLQNAKESGAEIMVTTCPMCQLNLDAYQAAVNAHFGTKFKIPILYFTQLMGLAFGLSERVLGIGQEIVSAGPALESITDQLPAKPKKVRPSKEALPVPSYKEGN